MKNLFDSEGRRVGWLLTEIERQTAERLSEESRLNLLDEVACHLDAAIQARLELGMTPVEAEREAVDAFGHPQAYVDDLLRIHEGGELEKPKMSGLKGDRRTMLIFWAMTILSSVSLLIGAKHWSGQVCIASFVVLGPIFATYSYRARRVQLVPLFLATALGCAMFTLGFTLTWDDLWSHGGMGFMPKWQAKEEYKSAERALPQIEALIRPLEQRAKLHARYESMAAFWQTTVKGNDVEFFKPTGFPFEDLRALQEVPIPHGIPRNFSDPQFQMTWKPAPDSKITYQICLNDNEAARIWRDEGQPLFDGLVDRKEHLKTEMAAIKEAEADSIPAQLVPAAAQSMGAAGVWFGIWGVVNLIFGGLGWFFGVPARIRRRETA
jgi:hypothetical protein